MQIKSSQLKLGYEVDSFFGEIGINRGRYTLTYDPITERYLIVKVMFATEKTKQTKPETEYETTCFKDLMRNWNRITGENDIGIND